MWRKKRWNSTSLATHTTSRHVCAGRSFGYRRRGKPQLLIQNHPTSRGFRCAHEICHAHGQTCSCGLRSSESKIWHKPSGAIQKPHYEMRCRRHAFADALARRKGVPMSSLYMPPRMSTRRGRLAFSTACIPGSMQCVCYAPRQESGRTRPSKRRMRSRVASDHALTSWRIGSANMWPIWSSVVTMRGHPQPSHAAVRCSPSWCKPFALSCLAYL
mmetsp:Transcript_43404/g.108018  ORF Transcript_43404/g.108018 Transcript_43404/m.108018 type:complete len:215 (+) Transcript_43404:341-985(+)